MREREREREKSVKTNSLNLTLWFLLYLHNKASQSVCHAPNTSPLHHSFILPLMTQTPSTQLQSTVVFFKYIVSSSTEPTPHSSHVKLFARQEKEIPFLLHAWVTSHRLLVEYFVLEGDRLTEERPKLSGVLSSFGLWGIIEVWGAYTTRTDDSYESFVLFWKRVGQTDRAQIDSSSSHQAY